MSLTNLIPNSPRTAIKAKGIKYKNSSPELIRIAS